MGHPGVDDPGGIGFMSLEVGGEVKIIDSVDFKMY